VVGGVLGSARQSRLGQRPRGGDHRRRGRQALQATPSKNNNSTSGWETTVKFDDGSRRTIRHSTAPAWTVGQRVTVDNGAISLASN
jgi:hypothetical protein